MTIVDPERDERGWAITDAPGTTPDPVNDFTFLSEALRRQRPRIRRPRDGAGAVGSRARPHRQQRVGRHHPHVRPRVRRLRRAPGAALLPGRAARRDRRDQRVRLRERQRRRLPHRLREDAGRLRARVRQALRRARRARRAPRARAATCVGDGITEADWRLFPTLVRFDAVYVGPLPVQPAARSSTTRTCRATCASSTSTPASPRPWTWITSSGTTTARTRHSTRRASCPSARRSTSPRRTAAST